MPPPHLGKDREEPRGGPAGPGRPRAASRRRTTSVLHASWWRRRTGEVTARARALHARVETRLPVITRLVDRMVSVNIFDSATRLAAQCFLTAIPLLFVVSAYAPKPVQEQLVSSLSAVFGLTGAAKQQLDKVFSSPDSDLRQAIGVVGGLMVLLSATAVSRAMQRLCKRAWAIPRSGTRVAAWRWLAWIVLWVLALMVQGPLRDGFGLGAWLGIPITVITQTALWWWTQHLLLGGLVGWGPLLPGSVITGVAVTGLSLVAHFYMPRALNRTLAEYGSAGSVFVLLSWLIVVCVAVAISISTGAVLAREPFLAHRLGPPDFSPGDVRRT
ncbi:YhjD/YihY/BrkB family envelope integrity protein [Streptomyces fructofermentans]|uniref:YhjD/YihY/BrkB family envelope integrity protein n=1 Tax=Streptomyces fructofermentans TaxID=152141 RepID=UPI0033C28A80